MSYQKHRNTYLHHLLHLAGPTPPVSAPRRAQPELRDGQTDDETSDDYNDANGSLADSDGAGDMANEFDTENGTDPPELLNRLDKVKVAWDHRDVEYWFTELENQMTLINCQSQWLKRVILVNNLPSGVKDEMKEYLKKTKAQAGTTIYKDMKTQILELYGQKDDEAFEKAMTFVLKDKPSALCKALYEELCDCEKPLEKCCAAKTVLGLWKRQLPQQVRTSIAGVSLKDPEALKNAMKNADNVFTALKGPALQVSAVRPAGAAAAVEQDVPEDEVAAFGRGGGPRGRGRGGHHRG